MYGPAETKVHDLTHMRGQTRLFIDRTQAGQMLASFLRQRGEPRGDAIVLGIPAGGVAVAAQVAAGLDVPLDVAVVSKITPSFNSEVGFGAVGFDGTIRLNYVAIEQLGLDSIDIGQAIDRTRERVERRVAELRAGRPALDLHGRQVLLVDDGIASGATMCVAVEACRGAGAETVTVAVPTGHDHALEQVAELVNDVYCLNLRNGYSFAVADAYRRWRDVPEAEVANMLRALREAS